MEESPKNKKIIHKIGWYSIEFEEKKDLFEKYEKIFFEDFKDELNFLQINKKEEKEEIEKAEEAAEDAGEEDDSSKASDSEIEFHNIFRSIAKKTHPDLHGEKYEELFKLTNEAYNNKNWSNLINIANELEIPIPEFSEEANQLIENDLKKMKRNIEIFTDSLAWIWSEKGADKNIIREQIKKILNINEDDFKEFLKNKKF